jgi:hypothetical protein
MRLLPINALFSANPATTAAGQITPVSRSRHLEWKLQTEDFRVAATAGATDIGQYR